MASKQKPQPAGAKALRGSDEAKRKAAVFLEALTGVRTTQSASDELGIALARYYVLETRMLQAMIDALEPKPRGRQRSAETELKLQRVETKRLEREVLRLQSLYRATQRALGVKKEPLAKSKSKKTTKKRRQRKETRGDRVLKQLRNPIDAVPIAKMPQEQGGAP